jgi:hypothetical protein
MHRFLLLALAATMLIVPSAAAAKPAAAVWSEFQGETVARPSSFPLAQDGSVGLTRLHWTGWGTSVATGAGYSNYRLWPKFKFASSAGGEMKLTDPVTCNGIRYYERAFVIVKSLAYGSTVPAVHTQSLKLVPTGCK